MNSASVWVRVFFHHITWVLIGLAFGAGAWGPPLAAALFGGAALGCAMCNVYMAQTWEQVYRRRT